MKKNNARSALGPVSIRRYITLILILLSVMDGSIFTFHLGPIEKSNLINIEDKN